ncbi:MAG: sigma-54-dependent Fis family transcriptional regulator [Fibrobacteres bacterium]|nr:sigma-54-dependent Fis family transcriptional regulator [Fibrobacterota bacterium]
MDKTLLLAPRNISIIVNDAGDILHVAIQTEGFAYSIIKEISATGNIRKFFGIKQDESIARIFETGKVLFATSDKFDFSTGFHNIYSELPLLTMRLFPIADAQYLATIVLSSLVPLTFEKNTGIQFYLNEDSTISAFNQTFFNVFGTKGEDPHKLLHRNISDFITPTPEELQKKHLDLTTIPPTESWHEIWNKDYKFAKEIDKEICDSPTDFKPSEEGLMWEAHSDYGSFLTLPISVNLRTHNVKIKIRFQPSKSSGPFIILGDSKEVGSYRDSNGYLTGISNNRFIYKREGFISTRSPLLKYEHINEIEFMNVGNAMFGSIADKGIVYKYFEFDPVDRSDTAIILYLRSGDKHLLHSISIYVSLKTGESPAEELLVQGRGSEQRYFLLNRFDSYLTSSVSGKVTGWRLQDITELQNRLNRIENQYQKELSETTRLKRMLGRFSQDPDEPVGSSKVMARTLETAARAADSSATILLLGETGTGKEVLARHIHKKSQFASGPFIKTDCSALPQSLIESELFGYEKGAFTGALKTHEGLFERADQGTLFLDEIGNLSAATQVKLLQFLQDFTVTRLGGTTPRKLTLRIITATNVDLSEAVRKGLFREDLYYRLAVVTILLPPLRERLNDLSELCHYFLNFFNRLNRKKIRSISAAAFTKLYSYSWPGNIRELKNIMERAVIFCDTDDIQADHITLSSEEISVPVSGKRKKNAFHSSREEIEALLAKHNGVVLRVAEELQISPRTLYYGFKKLGIKPNGLRTLPHKRD